MKVPSLKKLFRWIFIPESSHLVVTEDSKPATSKGLWISVAIVAVCVALITIDWYLRLPVFVH